MHPGLGMLPPLRPVPEPRVTTGVPVSLASLRICDTCSVVRTKTTTLGMADMAAVPSKEYGMRSSREVRTSSGATRARSRFNTAAGTTLADSDDDGLLADMRRVWSTSEPEANWQSA